MSNGLRFSYVFTAFLLLCFFSSAAHAQRGGGGGGGGNEVLNAAIEWDKRAEIGDRLTAHGLDLLGDSIDPHTGTISFRQTDISLPGNSELPVALTRELTPGYFHSFSVDVEFGDWSYSVPRLHLVTAASSNWSGARCSDPQSVFAPQQYSGATGANAFAYPVEYSNGLILDAPGHGSQQVLKKSPTVTVPFPSTAKYITAQNWYLICGSAIGGGEGFIAIAPNGDRYRFDRYIQVTHRNLGSVAEDGLNSGGTRHIGRIRAMLMATEVTDVHGNWVRYVYDTSDRLTQIHANDGRSITLGYTGSSKVVSSATANGRVWNYSYATETVADALIGDYGNNKQVLSSVTRPDGLSWSFSLLNMHHRARTGTRCHNIGGTMSLMHPNGVTGSYTVSETLHRRGFAEWMTETTLRCSGGFVNTTPPTYYDVYHAPIEVMSVSQKTLSGPSMPTSQWVYTYESDVDEVRYPVGHQFEGHPIATSETDPTNWTKVLNPDGSETTYYHFWNILLLPGGGVDAVFAGKLDRQETRVSAGGTVLQTVENHYVQTGIFGSTYLPNAYGGAPISNVITPESSGTPINVSKTVTLVDGDTYTTEFSYNTTQTSAAYSYGSPIQTKVFSNVSTNPRIIDVVYEHNSTNWVLALPKSTTINGRLIDEYNYYSSGALHEHRKYAVLVTTIDRYTTGDAAGQPSAVYDALNRKTELLDWKRGTSQRIKRADNLSVYQYVDNNGWMTSSKDARGFTTSYTRDNMGRLTLINPPGSWANTSISYDFSGGGAVQTITQGQSKTTITYDAMFRPMLERSQALDTGWSSYVNREYDTLGRVSFESQPSSSATTTAGIDFTYDGLGRIKTEAETVSPFVTQTHNYYNEHRHQITDPSGQNTTYFQTGYEGPGSGPLRKIYQPMGVNTYLHRNVWGQLYRVQQVGTHNGFPMDQSRYYYFDNQQRVCRHYVPEQGATKYEYDAAGQLVAYAKGQGNSGCTVPNSGTRVSLNYDSLGRLTTTDYLSVIAPDITRSYDADGNLLTVNRGGVNWTYAYNELGLPTSETLALDSRSYPISYLYNTSGHMTRKTLPTARQINYTPDGLGRHKTIKDGTATLASNTSYHPSGDVSSITYGNGQVLSQTLNARLLPLRLLSSNGSQTAIDQTFSYDARANLTGIVDGAVSGNNRTHGYDALNRLTSASGPWGSGNYTYDALGNLRQKVLGSRTVNLSYDVFNRLSQSVDTGPSGTRSVGHDARGNVTTLGGLTFGYDVSDQPVNVSGAATGTYRYDGNFKRVKAVVNGKTIYSVYDASGALVHIDAITDGNKTDYVTGPSGSLARIKNNVVTYLHPDYLGSAQSGTNSAGSVLWREQYTPFGEELQGPAANNDQAGYTGHIRDSATGLNYMQARYYDPTIGRFLSVDPVGFTIDSPMSFGRYTYANNNPYLYVDPDGEFAITLSITIAIGVRVGFAAYRVYRAHRAAAAAAAAATVIVSTPGDSARRASNSNGRNSSAVSHSSPADPGNDGDNDNNNVDRTKKLPVRLRNKLKRVENQTAAGGNRGVSGSVTPTEARALGERFVGPGFRTSKTQPNTIISQNGLRQFRGPSAKKGINPVTGKRYSNTGVQANFQSRTAPSGRFTTNVHLDVKP